jgi:hypothetical protein
MQSLVDGLAMSLAPTGEGYVALHEGTRTPTILEHVQLRVQCRLLNTVVLDR